MNVTINGSLCGDPKVQGLNLPCTSLTLCQHGTSNCQTINNMVVDTGSTGIRIFSSLVTVPTIPVMVGNNRLAECITFTAGDEDWGSIAYVDVQMAGEPAVQVPIQLLDPNFVATLWDTNAKTSQNVNFMVGNADTIVNSSNYVFSDLVVLNPGPISSDSSPTVLWGLPFYMGRTVYSGIEGMRSPLGRGLYYAY